MKPLIVEKISIVFLKYLQHKYKNKILPQESNMFFVVSHKFPQEVLKQYATNF